MAAAYPPDAVTTVPAQLGRTEDQLRVLLAVESAGSGAGRHVVDLAAGLLQRHHQVCLAYSAVRAEPWFARAVRGMHLLCIHPIEMYRSPGWRDLRSAMALRRLIETHGPFDILHGHSSKAGALLRLATLGRQMPRVYTPHAFITLDPSQDRLRRAAYGGIERALAGLTDVIICVSQAERDHAERLGIDSQKLTVVHNGVAGGGHGDRDAARRQLGVERDAICIGFVGRLSPQKGVDRLIAAFGMADRQISRLRLVIVGDGPELPDLRALVRDLGLSQRVVFTGAVDGPALMPAFDVFALCSRYEAFPYVLLEAAAQGLPIVMTETGGAGTVVKNGHNGYAVPQGQIERLAARIVELARQPLLRRRMGEASRRVSTTFTLDAMVEETLTVYRRLLRDTAPAYASADQ